VKSTQVKPVMNVAPLVDVVLVLLIIFMVITPMLSKTFWLNLPKRDEKVEEPPPNAQKNIVVLVTKTGDVLVNSENIPRDALKERIARMLAPRPEKVIYFDAEDDAPYASTVEVMDISRRGGATTIAILTEKLQR